MAGGGFIKSLELAKACFSIAEDKKGNDCVILDLKPLTNIADYFFICSGNSSRHIKTLAESIEEGLQKKGIKLFKMHSDLESSWIVLDYINVIVHIFSDEKRRHYRLEQLWGDAKVI